jgi:hypothetical protein
VLSSLGFPTVLSLAATFAALAPIRQWTTMCFAFDLLARYLLAFAFFG